MKNYEEIKQYRNLNRRMIAKADLIGVNWARYYAALLQLGGKCSEQYMRNFFIDDMKKLKHEHLALIYNDLEEHGDIKILSQQELKSKVLGLVEEIGKISVSMSKHFDSDEEINKPEACAIIPATKKLYSKVEELLLNLEESKARG